MISLDPAYVAARRVLLDALVALSAHADALIVAGAQAVYLHTGEGDLAVAPFTTDGDLTVDPSALADSPLLETAMREAGFDLALYDGHVEPGIWVASTSIGDKDIAVPVDLIVPEGAATGGGRRGARLGAHGRRAARRALGLEAALVDNAPTEIAALEPGDQRKVTANVAGSAALLVAKAHKLHDRAASGRAERINDKDASDVVRIMQTTNPGSVGATLATLATHPIAGATSIAAIGYLEKLFGRRGRLGIKLASRALRLALPETRVEAICVAYVETLVSAARARSDS